jgi:antitoxin (DNA-binding transcriptional repressor) of toxin-antitoxin stability system
MVSFPLETIGDVLADLIRRAEEGETVVLTRNGRPVLNVVLHRRGGIDLAAGDAFLRSRGIDDPFPYVADDFDTPLPEDFLIRPEA